jgi:hypothetical protein
MLLKVTLKICNFCVIIFLYSCTQGERGNQELELQRIKDSVAEARIDSAYAAIKSRCDTLMIYRVPQMVDSFMKDSALLQFFFDSTPLFTDADKKVEKVIRRLQADCDASLQKETYRIARLRQRPKPLRHKQQKT